MIAGNGVGDSFTIKDGAIRVAIIGSALLVLGAQQPPPQDTSLLPFVSTDTVTRVDPTTGGEVILTGVIEDLTGDRIVLRRGGGGRAESIRLREVRRFQFSKSPEFEEGLRQLHAGQWAAAMDVLNRAVLSEPRPWVQREIDAAAAQSLLGMGERPGAIARIEDIVERDPSTRHIHLLPLVWDERLNVRERLAEDPAGLKAGSPVRRLCAASAVLHLPEHRAAAMEELAALRVSGQPGIQELAEVQLWRVTVLRDESLRSGEFALWRARVEDLDPWFRGGPMSVLGRLSLADHNFDEASLCFLWTPVMYPTDRPMAAACLIQAAEALKSAGRPVEAARLLEEAKSRYPDCSAVIATP